MKTDEMKEKQTSIMKRITLKHEKRLHHPSVCVLFQEDLEENEDPYIKEEVDGQITKRSEGMPSNKNPSYLSMNESEVDDSLKGFMKKSNNTNK